MYTSALNILKVFSWVFDHKPTKQNNNNAIIKPGVWFSYRRLKQKKKKKTPKTRMKKKRNTKHKSKVKFQKGRVQVELLMISHRADDACFRSVRLNESSNVQSVLCTQRWAHLSLSFSRAIKVKITLKKVLAAFLAAGCVCVRARLFPMWFFFIAMVLAEMNEIKMIVRRPVLHKVGYKNRGRFWIN